MEGLLGNLLNGLVEIWKTIGIPQKVSIVLVMLVTIFAIGGVVYMGSRPDWQILESDMTRETAAKVHDIAKDAGVEVKLMDSGRTIMVPSKEVYSLRLRIASEGIKVDKDNTVGWDIFDNTSLAMTELQQQVAKQRAQQGELEKMISKMPGIVSAKVMLTPPKKRAFRKDNASIKASVLLNMGRGATIPMSQANTIRYLVSSAISGLEPNNVNISDSNGRLLAKPLTLDEIASGGSAGNQIEYKTKFENKIKQKVEDLLAFSVGANNVVAMVSCDVDFDTVDKVIEDYVMDKYTVISEDTVEETSTKAGKSSGGQTTVAVSGANRATKSASGDSQKKTSTKRQFIIPKIVQKVSVKGGTIRKLTVAVAVNNTIVKDPETIKTFKKLVEQAIAGASSIGKPTVSVEAIPFVKEEETAWTPPVTDTIMSSVERITNSPIVRPILGAILLAILFVVFKNYFNKTSVEATDMNAGLYGEENYNNLEAAGESNAIAALETDMSSIVTELGDKAGSSPEAVASIMENWLNQD